MVKPLLQLGQGLRPANKKGGDAFALAEQKTREPPRQRPMQPEEARPAPEQERAKKQAADARILRGKHHAEYRQGHQSDVGRGQSGRVHHRQSGEA